MINLYEPKTKSFNNNGIANLKNMISCIVTEELNGIYQLDAEHPLLTNTDYDIIPGSILKVNCGYDQPQLFRIKRKTPNMRTMKLYAEHISYDLRDNNLLDVYPQNLSGYNALNWIFSRTQIKHNFTSFSDISKVGTARYVNKNPIQAIIGDEDNAFVKIWGGEIVRDNFMIKMLEKRGNDFGYKLTKTKNITGLEFDEDISEVVTRVIPKAYNGIKLPEVYVDSPLIVNYPHPIIKEIEFPDIKLKDENSEEGYETLEEVYIALKESVKKQFDAGLDKPKINVKVDFVELSKTKEYSKYKNLEMLHLGDYVTLMCENYHLKLRVVKTKFNSHLDRYINIELGDLKQTFFDSSKQSIQQLEDQMIKVHFPSYLIQAKNAATEQLISAMGGFVYKTQNELFIMDSNDPLQAVKVWRWNLNGLGYSKLGVNGPYEIAITQDGRIVADFITTGKLNTNVIEGYNQLEMSVKSSEKTISQILLGMKEINLQIQENFDFVRAKQGTYQIHITDAMSYDIRKLIIKGTHVPFFIYANDNLYANDDLYLDDNDKNNKTTYTIVVDTSPRSNPSNNKKEYVFTLNEPLRKYGNYTDELIINEDYKVQLIRRIHCIDNEYRLYDEPIIQYLENTQIILFENENYIYIKETEILQLDITYLNNNPLNDQFVNQIEFKNVMTQTRDTFNVQLEKKVDNNSIIAEINATTQTDHGGSEVFLGADKIRFNGKIFDLTVDDISIISKNLRIMPDGTIEAINGKFSGTIDGSTINGGLIKGATVVLEDVGGTQDASFSIRNSKNSDNLILTSNCIQMVGNHSAFYIILDEIVGDNDNVMSLQGFSIKGNSDCYIAGNLQCGKDIYCNTLIQTSVESKKKNIVKFSNALDVILQGDIYSYRYKSEESTTKKHIGLVIGSNYKAPKEVISENGIDTYSMSAVEWQAIKELIKITELQKSKIEELEKRISKIEGEKK